MEQRHKSERVATGDAATNGSLQGTAPSPEEAAYRQADESGDSAATSNLGVLLETRGEVIEALGAYLRADERGDASGAFNLGALLERLGETSLAHEAYGRAAHRAPADSELQALARAAASATGEVTVASPGVATSEASRRDVRAWS